MIASQTLTHFLGWMDLASGLIMFWSLLRTTGTWGFHTPAAQWATLRRFIYSLICIALFGLGAERLSEVSPLITTCEFFYQLTLVVGVTTFPVMRALNLITQDMLRSSDVNGYEPRRRPF